MSDLFVAQGHRTSLTTGKETTYGQKAASLDTAHNFETWALDTTDNPVSLDGSRGQIDTPFPAQGGRSISGSVTTESTADVIDFWLAMGLGAQTAPSHNIVATTLTASTLVGATSFQVANGLAIFPGEVLTVGTANPEPLTVATVSGNTFTTTTGAANAHTSGSNVVLTSATAYLSKFTLGTPLPSFTAQITPLNGSGGSFSCDDFLGCMIDSLALQFAKGQIRINPSVVANDMAPDNSPTAPTYSTKNPLIFEQQFTPVQWNATVIGTGVESTVISVNATLNNALQKDLFSMGNGNKSRKPQEGKRSVSGTLAFDFASTTVRDAFQVARTGGQKTAVQLTIPVAGTDLADATLGIPFGVVVVLPKIYLSKWNGGYKSNGPLQQSASFTAHPSGIGTNDSLTVYYIGTRSTVR